jgi:nucleoside-diphosphate-sugar epimerase
MLVLGAGGFIGGAIRRMLEENCEPGSYSLHFRSTPVPARTPDRGAAWAALDLLRASPDDYRQLLDRLAPEVIINCAGLTVGDPDQLRLANVDLVTKLIDAVDHRGGGHIVHLGSAAEYGSRHASDGMSETCLATPVSAYGVTKLEATRALGVAAADGRCASTVLRVFNPIGRGSPNRTLPGRAAESIEQALAQGHDAIHLGWLGSWRDYIDVRDVARAALAAAAAAPAPGNSSVLNVGRGVAVLSRSVVKGLAAVAGYQGAIIESQDGSGRSARLEWQQADISRIRRELGWSPSFSLEDSFRELWGGVHGDVGV